MQSPLKEYGIPTADFGRYPIQVSDTYSQIAQSFDCCLTLYLDMWWIRGIPSSALNQTRGDVVMDPFMGTGQTGIICKKLNREFIGIELDGNAYDISKERIENYVIQKVLF